MNRRLLFGIGAAVCSAALFAGCGGGGGGGNATLPVTQTAQPTATPTPSVAARGGGTASFTFLLPFQRTASTNRKAMYVSPSTQSVTVALLTVNGSPPATPVSANINIGGTQPGCTQTGTQISCDLSIVIPIGADTFSVTAYSGLNSSCCMVATATVPQTVYANAANHVILTLSGTIASLYLFLPDFQVCNGDCSTPTLYAPTAGTPTREIVIPIPLDASGNQIVLPGTYSSPITLSTAQLGGAPAGALLFTVNGGPPAATVQLAGPADQAFLVGQSVIGHGSYNINATYPGGSAHYYGLFFQGLPPLPTPTPTPSPTPSPTPTPNPISVSEPALNNNTLAFFAGSSTRSLSVTDTANATGLSYSLTGCSGTNAASIVTINPAPGTATNSTSGTFNSPSTLAITPTASTTSYGTCSLVIIDSSNATSTITINLFAVTGTVQ